MARGRAVYNTRCYFCHGYDGDARTVAAKYLDPSPRDFTKSSSLTKEQIERAIRHGRAPTAMQSFATILDDAEIEAVAAFVQEALVRCASPNTRYHTAENGWPDHERRNGAAFPFVEGVLAIDSPRSALTAAQRSGLFLFKRACSVCHEGKNLYSELPAGMSPAIADTISSDQSRAEDSHLAAHREVQELDGHEPRDHGNDDSHEDESYERDYGQEEESEHDRIPVFTDLTPRQRVGQDLYQRACALCHAADGTGRNWIGTFLDPSPPSFTDTAAAARLDDGALRQATLYGLPNTSMPAFRNVLDSEQIDAIIAYVRRAFLPDLR